MLVRRYSVFEEEPGGGNVAGVVFDDDGLTAETMQAIAGELALPTTGFVQARSPLTHSVRYFSPRAEMDMCGHVSVAIFEALAACGRIEGAGPFTLLSAAGAMRVEIEPVADGRAIFVTQPDPVFDRRAASRDEAAALLGLDRRHIARVESARTALDHLFVQLTSRGALAQVQVDDERLSSFSSARRIDTVGVWAPGDGSSEICLRDLCHGVGSGEEAASGTTNGALAALLMRRRQLTPDGQGRVRVVARQGLDMGRPSVIRTSLRVDDGRIVEVRVGGLARFLGETRL